MAPGGPERVPGWLMMAMGGVGQPTSDLSLRFPLFFLPPDALSLRFPMLLGPRTLSQGACAVKPPKAELSITPPWGDFWGFWA